MIIVDPWSALTVCVIAVGVVVESTYNWYGWSVE